MCEIGLAAAETSAAAGIAGVDEYGHIGGITSRVTREILGGLNGAQDLVIQRAAAGGAHVDDK